MCNSTVSRWVLVFLFDHVLLPTSRCWTLPVINRILKTKMFGQMGGLLLLSTRIFHRFRDGQSRRESVWFTIISELNIKFGQTGCAAETQNYRWHSCRLVFVFFSCPSLKLLMKFKCYYEPPPYRVASQDLHNLHAIEPVIHSQMCSNSLHILRSARLMK